MPLCPSCGRESAEEFAFCPYCGGTLAEARPPREQRKVVTVLFCDVVGSTELGESADPEALRALLARYFDRMKAIVERHGGSVEKFIGDAVMAVFGVPVVHEDDALRAARAALEMRDVLPELGVQARIGIDTGEVVTGTEERLATGDAVNVAARLEQAAHPGEVLLGEETLRLVREAVDVEALEPVRLKGKAEPVSAYRLVAVSAEPQRRREAPMVGREREQRLLADAWERAVSERSCHLFTVLGPAGVGKSRLVAEFLAGLHGAVVARGRCLPYGEGITYWPVVEVVKQLPAVELEDRAAAAIRDLVGEQEAAASSEEIGWAFRKLLEAVASERPLACVLDDLQWGEETFLDLVEHVADLSREVPILLLCMARPDLLDRRSGWGGGKVNATTVLLEPLRPDETDRLIESLGDIARDLRERIREAAEGNPLFVEEMVAMVRESPGQDVVVPPTIQALLAARIDQLDPRERSVLQCGSVEGRLFHRGSVEALTREDGQVTSSLTALVRKELVRPDKAQLPNDDAYRFRHLLIRDAAYDALPKAARAELHERFAEWLEQHGPELVELEEILGYHLEQAYSYRRSLGMSDERQAALASRAAERLRAAGHRALGRNDMPAAVNLLERAAALLPENDVGRLADLPALGRALTERNEWEQAEAMLSAAVDAARGQGEHRVAADAVVALSYVRLHMDPDLTHERVHRDLADAVRVFEQEDDESGLAFALSLEGVLLFWRGRAEDAVGVLDRALVHARRAGNRMSESQSVRYIANALMNGPRPAPAALEELELLRARAKAMPVLEAWIARAQAHLEAMLGRFDVARKLLDGAAAVAEDLGLGMFLAASLPLAAGEVELLAGDPAAAEVHLRSSCETLERAGDRGHLATIVAYLTDALVAQGRGSEAMRLLDVASRWTLADDLDAQIGWRRAKAKVIVHEGKVQEAESLAREAVALAERTDYLEIHGHALRDLAVVLEVDGKPDEAAAALGAALELYERKGNVVRAEQTRERLAELAKAPG